MPEVPGRGFFRIMIHSQDACASTATVVYRRARNPKGELQGTPGGVTVGDGVFDGTGVTVREGVFESLDVCVEEAVGIRVGVDECVILGVTSMAAVTVGLTALVPVDGTGTSRVPD